MKTTSSPPSGTAGAKVTTSKPDPKAVPVWLRLAPLYIVVSALLVYVIVLRFDFIDLDDIEIIKQRFFIIGHLSNIKLAFTTDAFLGTTGAFYRPLQTVTFMLDAAVGGTNPFMYHLVNLLLHIASCLSLYWLLLTLRYQRLPSLILSTIYAVHPVFVSAVAWVPSRGDELLTLFAILSVILFIKSLMSRSPWLFYLHGLTLFLAFLSKETAVVIPVLCLLTYYLEPAKTAPRPSLVRYLVVWIAVGGIWFVLRSQLHSAGMSASVGIVPFISNFPMIPETVGKFLLPFHFRLIPQYNLLDTGLGLASMVLLVLLILRTKGRFNRRVNLGLLWFVLTLLPVMAFRNFDAAYIFDYFYHRSYLTNIGLVIVLAEIVTRSLVRPRRSRLMVAGAIVVVAYCGTTAAAELRHYRNPLAFYNVAIARSPRSAMCYNNRANYYANERKNYTAALADFSKALEIYPGYTTAITNRGVTYMMLGRYRQALADIDGALSVNAFDPDNVFRRGQLRYVLKDYARALSDFDQVLTSNGLYPRIYSARAGCLAMLGRGSDALSTAEQALRTDSKDEDAFNSRGLAKRALGDATGAIDDFNMSIRMKADGARPYNNRGAVYFGLGQWERSRQDFTKAIELDSAYAEAYNNRGSVEHRLNKLEEAMTDLNAALRINPDFADAYQNRGVVRNSLRLFREALDDFNRSIGMAPGKGEAYLGRGIAKFYLKDTSGSCDDWRRAATLGSGDAGSLITQYCK